MSEPWRMGDRLEFYEHGQDYRIDDKLDRLREAVLALAENTVGIKEWAARDGAIRLWHSECPPSPRLLKALGSLQTAEERHEYHN